jgi:acetyl-CoA carboxylase carboxyl transferase subunit alpha
MLLDFEKPIVELEDKIADMKSLAQQSSVDVTDALQSLQEKLQKLKEETYLNLTRWQRVQLSRHQNRPYTLDYIYEITDDLWNCMVIAMYLMTGLWWEDLDRFDGQTIMFVGQQKGRNTKQRQERNFGMANPEG